MLLIGESLNSAIPKVGQAVLDRNETFVRETAVSQVESGAEMLDVGAGVAGGDEVQDLQWMVSIVQREVNVPLMLDSANPEALFAALPVHQGSPIVNSISGEKKKIEKLLPVVAERRCRTVILCMDDDGIPKTAEARVSIAQNLANRLVQKGMNIEDCYIDFLALSVGSDWKSTPVSFEALRLVRREMPKAHTFCGLSNVSFGMPVRTLLNSTFLAMVMTLGLDTLLVNVRDPLVMGVYRAAKLLIGDDPACMGYLKAYRAGSFNFLKK